MRIIQIANVLDYGDGVSNSIISLAALIRELGYETETYTKWSNEKVAEHTDSIKNYKAKNDDILLVHYSGKSEIIDEIKKYKCKKVLIYHNVTPPEFFSNQKHLREHCEYGIQEVIDIREMFDYALADSNFNKMDLESYGYKDVVELPILINGDELKKFKISNKIVAENKNQEIFLFVGRVVSNKKHDDIVEIFEHYYNNFSKNSKLIFVGNDKSDMSYLEELKRKISRLNCKNNIEFTGMVSESELYTYYRIADIFVCMSEHEGFCIPLVESMLFEIPIVAYNSTGVPHTMNGSGALVLKKDFKEIASLCNVIINDEYVKNEIINKQLERANYFSRENIKKILLENITKWERTM